LFLLVGLLAGVLAGLFGVGGGVIIIPALVYVFHFNQHKAQGTSLVAMLLPVAILAVVRYYKAGNADIRGGLLIAAGLFVGAYIGAVFSTSLHDWQMKKLFAVFLLAISVKMLLEK
jgi:uncharacterized membrane protein YfcA